MIAEGTHGRRTDAVANRARILAAARVLLAERGLDMEMTELAERAGVGVGTLYRHFANRDDLVRAILTQTHKDVLSRLQVVAEIEDPREALRQIPLMLTGESICSLLPVMQDPRSAKVMRDVKHGMDQPEVGEITKLMAEIVERGIRAGVFRADLDPPATAAAILGSVGSVVEMLGASRPLDELARLLTDLLSSMVAVR